MMKKQRIEDERIAQLISSMITHDISIFYISVRCKVTKLVEDGHPGVACPQGIEW
jgi:hypothetical protein